MTTTAVTTAAGPILAIDLGKYKCVACVYRSATEHTFQAIDTSRTEVARLIGRTRPAVVVVEACSLAGWVHDLCGELGVLCQVANTGAEAWKYKHAKRKTDRDDALRLAQLYALGQLPEVVVPVKATREWRALIAHRQALVTQRVAAQTASARSWSARACRRRAERRRGVLAGWPGSGSSPGPWPPSDAARQRIPVTAKPSVITQTELDILRYICSGWFGMPRYQNRRHGFVAAAGSRAAELPGLLPADARYYRSRRAIQFGIGGSSG